MTANDKKRLLAIHRLQQAAESLDEARQFVGCVRTYLEEKVGLKKNHTND